MLTGVLSCSAGLEAAGGFRLRAGARVLLMTSEVDGAGSSGAVPLDPGRTLEDAYEIAATFLEETSAFAAPATIRKAHLRVKRALRTPALAHCYFQLGLETRRYFFGKRSLFS